MCFNQHDGLKTSQNHNFLQIHGEFECPKFPKLWRFQNFDFRDAQFFPKFSQSLSPLRTRWVLPVVWPRAAAPEVAHRSIWQLRRVPRGLYSFSSRPTRPWMRGTTRAGASDDVVSQSWRIFAIELEYVSVYPSTSWLQTRLMLLR